MKGPSPTMNPQSENLSIIKLKGATFCQVHFGVSPQEFQVLGHVKKHLTLAYSLRVIQIT